MIIGVEYREARGLAGDARPGANSIAYVHKPDVFGDLVSHVDDTATRRSVSDRIVRERLGSPQEWM